MKKLFCIIIAAVLLITASSCGNGSGQTSSPETESSSSAPQKEYSVTELAQLLFSGVEYEDDLQPLGESDVDSIDFVAAYYAVEKESIAGAVLYAGSGATPEEICVIKAAEGKADSIKTAMEARLATLKTDFTDYNPEQMPKIDEASVYIKGDYAVLCVSGDADKVNDIIENYFK